MRHGLRDQVHPLCQISVWSTLPAAQVKYQLEVDPKADPEKNKRAYYEKLKKWHPDRNADFFLSFFVLFFIIALPQF
jgi:hypothetical protein